MGEKIQNHLDGGMAQYKWVGPLAETQPSPPPGYGTPYQKKFKIDGLVFEKVEACRMLSATMLLTIKALEKAGVPTCQIEADTVDARDWDDTKIKAQIASFIETLQ